MTGICGRRRPTIAPPAGRFGPPRATPRDQRAMDHAFRWRVARVGRFGANGANQQASACSNRVVGPSTLPERGGPETPPRRLTTRASRRIHRRTNIGPFRLPSKSGTDVQPNATSNVGVSRTTARRGRPNGHTQLIAPAPMRTCRRRLGQFGGPRRSPGDHGNLTIFLLLQAFSEWIPASMEPGCRARLPSANV